MWGTRRGRGKARWPPVAAGTADCKRAAHEHATASHGRIPRDSQPVTAAHENPTALPNVHRAQCPPTFLRGRIRALTPRACLLPRASPPGQGMPPPLSSRTKSGGGGNAPPPPRAVTPWCRPSCARPVCVCASDARSGRRRRRSCSLCGSRSCPGPRCGRCRRIRA